MVRSWILALAFGVASLGAAAAGTLETVRERGTLKCGVSGTAPGFSMVNARGEFSGFDVDYCRAVATAVLGDPTKVSFVQLSYQDRFKAVQDGTVDVLFHNATHTFTRDNTLGLQQGPVTFYDGQGFAVRRSAGIRRVAGLNGLKVCVVRGSTHEPNLTDFFQSQNMQVQAVTFDGVDAQNTAFLGGQCDAMTQDSSALAGALAATRNGSQFTILQELISKEPLGPFTRANDQQWSNIIEWVHHLLVEAEEYNVSKAQLDELSQSQIPQVQRILGRSGEFGRPLGLENDWGMKVIRAVGNYSEIFERNLGESSPMKLSRGLNGLWRNGGLQYAIPLR